ncbi:MAG: diguanylate cyclase, partial [Candidatus Heimdallarchaeota archaeon]|nr:diguanylate cyclase [Candidatus Heimdallarchaeota archaeon]
DGSIVHIETRCAPIFNEQEEFVGYRGVDIDITQRRQVELSLEESQRMLVTLTRNFPGIIYRCRNDEERTMEFISEGCLDLTGDISEDIIFSQKKSYIDLIHNADRKQVLQSIEKAVKDKEPFRFTYRIIDQAGKEKWVLEKGQAIFSMDGKLQNIEGFITDVSENKNFQQERELLNQELVKTNERLKQMTLRDMHTGLYNHRYFQEAIESEFDRARRQRSPLSVIMVDLDYFRSINDVYGHKFGDLVLQQLSAQLRQMVRKYDTLIRYGGEEFIIITPGVGRDMAFILAQRLIETVRLEHFGEEGHKIKLKCSVGVASFPEDKIVKGMEFISLVESVINQAKKGGGDRACSTLDLEEGIEVENQKKEGDDDVEFLQDKLDKLTKQANESLSEAIFAFAKTIEMKDHSTGEHVEKTVHYATAIAKEVGLPKNEIERIRQAAVLHDLGKIGISEKILLKDSTLTESEYEEIKSHPQIGVDILRP